MATKTKKTKASAGRPKKYPTRSNDWQAYSRENELCMRTGEKVPLAEQYTVHNDLDTNTAVMKKNAARKGAEKLWHGSKEAAEKRRKQNQRWLDKREQTGDGRGNGGGGKKTAKPKPKKAGAKAGAKKAAKPKATKAKKGGAKKSGALKTKGTGTKKAKAKGDTIEDPF